MKRKTNNSRQKTPVAPLHFPDPHELLEQAEDEVGHSDLKQYLRVIVTLRSKGFSFREIAEWLGKRGVPTNHNSVYHVFTKNVHDIEVHDVENDLEAKGLGEE